MRETLIQVAYLVASALFIIAIKLLNSPRTARLGNGLGALGMALGRCSDAVSPGDRAV
jgi:NAD(P) transhydrogenase subunit beta